MIDVRGVKKIYSVGNVSVSALKGVTFSIQKGEFVAIVGPSGSGKTTMMNILGCLDRPTEGRYTFEGISTDELDDDNLAGIRNRKIGFVFQTFNLLARHSALENVQLPILYSGATETKEKAFKALEGVGLSERTNHKPNELSGGECQRVAIARAVVMNPSLILADEPTGNLDTKTGDEIMNIFRSLNDTGSTIIVVTHEHEIASKCPRTIYTRDGLIEKDVESRN
jgi:putative ABC transport system ATP-binding protein